MQDRILAAGLQPTTSAQFVGLLAARRVCTDTSGDERMRKTSTWLLEQGTQTPSPAPDLIPAETRTENSHWDWYSERGHFRRFHNYKDQGKSGTSDADTEPASRNG